MRKSIMIGICLLFSLSMLTTSAMAGTTPTKDSTRRSMHRVKKYVISQVNKARRKSSVKDKVALEKLQKEYGSVVHYISDPDGLNGRRQFKSFDQIIKDGGGDCEDLTGYSLRRLIEMGVSKSKLGFQIWWEKDRTSGHVETLVWQGKKVYALGTDGAIVDAKWDLKGRRLSLRAHAVVRLDTGKVNFKWMEEIASTIYFE